jgi:hypothetical protein
MKKLRHSLPQRKLLLEKYQTLKPIRAALSTPSAPHESRMDLLEPILAGPINQIVIP